MIVCYCGGFHGVFIERLLHVRWHTGAAHSPSVKARSLGLLSLHVILEYETGDAQVRRACVSEELALQGWQWKPAGGKMSCGRSLSNCPRLRGRLPKDRPDWECARWQGSTGRRAAGTGSACTKGWLGNLVLDIACCFTEWQFYIGFRLYSPPPP